MGHYGYYDYDDSSWDESARDDGYPYTVSVSVSRGTHIASGTSAARTAADAVRFACADARSRWRSSVAMRVRNGGGYPKGTVTVTARIYSDKPFKRAGKPRRTISATLTLPEKGDRAPATGSFSAELVVPLYNLARELR